MAEPMTPEREAKARAWIARMQDPDAELTYGDYFARDLLAEVDRLRDERSIDLEALRVAGADLKRLRSELRTWQDAANSTDLDGDVRDHLHGLREWDDTGDDSAPVWLVESVVDLLAPIATGRDRLAEQVQRVQLVRAWTNEDGKKFVFADDLRAALNGEDGEPIETRLFSAFADADEEGVSLDGMTVPERTAFVLTAITRGGGRS